MKPVVVIQGPSNIDEVPRLGELSEQAEFRFASSADELRDLTLPGPARWYRILLQPKLRNWCS
jgi:hypothetical protein